jgi:uncharacterized membrane protein YoaT (DUF817 family)
VLVTVLFRLFGWESTRDVLVIAGFHLVGLAFELVKVPLGSWAYPEDAFTKILGVPLYSGFLYAAVGSYMVAAWRLFDLRVSGYLAVPTAVVAGAVYVNLITHHWLPDLRWPLAGLLVAVTWGAAVHFTVGGYRYRMPLALSFALIGFFLWIAENIATFFGAWRYPHQLEAWRLVDPAKAGAWAMLVSVTFVLVAAFRSRAGRLRETSTLFPRRDSVRPRHYFAERLGGPAAVTPAEPTWAEPGAGGSAGEAGAAGTGQRQPTGDHADQAQHQRHESSGQPVAGTETATGVGRVDPADDHADQPRRQGHEGPGAPVAGATGAGQRQPADDHAEQPHHGGHGGHEPPGAELVTGGGGQVRGRWCG